MLCDSPYINPSASIACLAAHSATCFGRDQYPAQTDVRALAQYGIGTMFSLAVLSFTVTVAMKMVGAVAANFAAQYMTMMALGAGSSPGVNTMALQQGGLGIFLTVLILSVPPMAASFFQGVLGELYALLGVWGEFGVKLVGNIRKFTIFGSPAGLRLSGQYRPSACCAIPQS